MNTLVQDVTSQLIILAMIRLRVLPVSFQSVLEASDLYKNGNFDC